MYARHWIMPPVLFALAVLVGCTSTSGGESTRVEPQARYVPKVIPAMSTEERALLAGNGYSIGTWSEKCGDPAVPQVRYFAEGEKYVSEVQLDTKVVRRAEIYDVRPVSSGVIKFKSHAKDFVSGQEFVAETKSGFVGAKRMVFDQSVIYLNGPNAGEPVVTVTDGYEMTGVGDAKTKGRRAPVMVRCQ